eukprot:CAMPEP_0118855216 /NCGR_PEP_ID=MMETSP1163-20130328/3128_1 /TAXON_ID=124430 /ORGANISM="Phaeomonas parva, Strain CCMP2877" /LENGTH=227 /DNA_ID=CAMNT_0006788067 /DNA_START=113 /DNA_END=797 /DNA_ORIENTATION=+
MEILWGFSIILESIAIIPQLITLQRYREVENLTSEVTEPPPEVYLTVIATGKTPDFDDDNTAVVDADDNGPPCCGSIDLEISDDENPNPNPKPKPNPSHQRNLFGPHRFDIMEIVWDFFIILVSIKIIPQLITLKRYREVENLMSDYIFFFGLYRGMYLLNGSTAPTTNMVTSITGSCTSSAPSRPRSAWTSSAAPLSLKKNTSSLSQMKRVSRVLGIRTPAKRKEP